MGMTLYSNLFMGGAFVPILSLFVAELFSHGGKCCTMGGAPGFRDALPGFSLQQHHRLHMLIIVQTQVHIFLNNGKPKTNGF